MHRYIGTKIIHAEPAARDGQPGYKVVYPDGYESWSPAAAFEAAYEPTDAMNFGLAIEALLAGHKVARAGWNGEGMYLYFVAGSEFTVSRLPLNAMYPEGTQVSYRPHIDMRDAQGRLGVWTASQPDMLARDWFIVEGAEA